MYIKEKNITKIVIARLVLGLETKFKKQNKWFYQDYAAMHLKTISEQFEFFVVLPNYFQKMIQW